MFNILNRITWVLSICTWILVVNIFVDYFFFGFIFIYTILSYLIKIFFFSDKFIKEGVLNFEERILNKVSIKNNFDKRNNFASQKVVLQEKIEEKKELALEERRKEQVMREKQTVTKENEVKKYLDIPDEIVYKNQEKETDVSDEIIYKEQEENIVWKTFMQINTFFHNFFAENLMAKVWWILLSIWIIFLMSLIYTNVWEVAKIIIWFTVWFVIYFIWTILYKKWFKTEWFILLWVWILINYIVILWWRFMVWDNDWYLWSWITFLFLILNTVFSILTSYIYSSKNLLLFSIVFAFLIPFLNWDNNSKPYIEIWYWLIISIWGLFISNYFKKKDDNLSSFQLFFISLIWWNILFLAAPFWNNVDYFVIKMIAYNLLNFLVIFLAYKNKVEKAILPSFIISFVFLALIMFSWSVLSSLWILILFIIWTIWLLIAITFFITIWIWGWLIYLLFLPILFALGFIFIGWAWISVILLPLFLLAYLWVFAFWIWNILTNTLKYVFFSVIWIFLIIWNINLTLNLNINLTMPIFVIISITAFLFILSTYYLSNKKDLSYLYTIWTLAWIFILLPIIKITWNLIFMSVCILVLFWIINYITPFINSNLVKNDSRNLVLWNIFWILFIWTYLFKFWDKYFPWISMWIWFFLLASLYFIWWFIMFNKIEKIEKSSKENNINFIYTFLAIAISLFSIAVALIFAKLLLVIALIWFTESTIIIFFANKLKSIKILIAWIILFLIWLVKYIEFIFIISFPIDLNSLNIWNIIWVILIMCSLFINVIFLKNITLIWQRIIKVLHTIWLFLSYILLIFILDLFNTSYIIVFSLSFVWIIWIIYNLLKDNFLKNIYLGFFIFLLLWHIFTADFISPYIYNYIFTFIVFIIIIIEYIYFRDNKSKKMIIAWWFYFFIISSIYLYNLTSDIFSLTIYWWILSLIWVHLWIWKWNKIIRTIWLYLLIVTLIKISLYDIWNSFDNPIIRVIALMFVWWIMMYISTLYSKNKLDIKQDLISNLWDMNKSEEEEKKEKNIEEKNIEEEDIKEYIKNVDISNIDSIKFILNNKKTFTIKSKKLFSIVKFVITNMWKSIFESWELDKIYFHIISRNKTDLKQEDYLKLTWIIKDFVDVWGEVIFINK